ncbi:PREDICTED: putative phosphoenolpyruvate synthase isoform X3 [Dinoponera quadriceps]|uniref:Phosphoenolpyruvate synthase isoform X3 n=1 Tax=Dinoponera quadriceps TaxID=609295 RepID=A0A6P3WWI5_DINQU|nr:PREDICTED: putative phosphoenolpyruvate synthase isoform X3 [Dinoponera quadriceps]
MEYIICCIQVIILTILPIWIYLWFDKRKIHQLSLYLGLDVQFSLKLWWALWCISKEKKMKNKFGEITPNLKEIFKPYADNPQIIMDENSCDGVFFYGADQKGHSLFVKMNHRGYRTAESVLQVTLSDGRVYVLPDYPHTVAMDDSAGQKWSASGLKIEPLEPRKRWRITYNGLLRNQSLDNVLDNMEHIRLNFIFIGHSPFEWPGDWSTRLHAAALAHEPWKGPDWMRKIKLLDYTGFDQWGSAIGQITFKDSTTSALYLRGFCQRRWGKHEFDQFRRTVTFLGVAASGAMYHLGVSRTKNSFSHMRFGHVNNTTEMQSKIDWTDLKMEDFEKQGDYVPANYRIKFRAADVEYDAVINHMGNDAINYYNGQPWRWAITIRNLRIKLNGSKGAGVMIVCYPYTGPNEMRTPIARIQHLKRPETLKCSFVLHFADKQCQNESVVGGKGYSLATLTSITTNDFVVPRGFCVTSFALEWQLQHDKQLRDMIADIVDISCGKKKEDLENYCKKTVFVIQNTIVEKRVKQAILEALKELDDENNKDRMNNRYAVRSSAVGEDSEETSAAGQNSTYLGVRTTDDVIRSVAKCWASLFSYQSVEYRRQNGLPIKACMGVCVQRMVDAEAAGVMFTRHPTTGDPSSIIITANYGLGETVVSGTVEPDTLTIHRKWDNTLTVSSSVPGNKGHKISLSVDGVIMNNLSEREIWEISISDATALRLAKIGLHLESFFGSARDIEWAIVGEQIYLLQARPITTIDAWTDFELTHELDSGVPADVDFMTFANVGEVLPRPICPLSITTILKVLNLSIGSKSYGYDCNYLHVVGMRCAMNYCMTFLRNVGEKITMANKMADIAICGRVITTPEVHKIAVEKLGVASMKQKMSDISNMFKWAWINERIVKEATNVYRKYELNANEFETARELYSVINKKYTEIFMLGIYHTHTSRVSVCYQMLAMTLLTAKSEDIISNHIADIAVLLSSCTNVISTEVPIALGKIAACIRKYGKAEDFAKVEPASAIDWLKSNCPPAAEKLVVFYDMHGHRCVQELDFISEPWILKPDSIINTIQSLATSIEENYVSKTLNVQDTIASLKTPMSSFIKWILQKVIPLSRKAVTRREMTKNFMVSMLHKMRVAYIQLGTLMVQENYMPDKNLIFFLTNYEIAQLLNNHHNPLIVRKALRRRKIYHQLSKVEYPEFCTGMPMPIQKTLDVSTSYGDNTKVEGTSVYGGSLMARACVITDLSEAKNIRHGDILITHCTDIGWSPYFPLLSGIVTELGGLISHGAVVAREYGLPCIVGAKHATQIFQTGDTVLLAADIGTLQLIKKG